MTLRLMKNWFLISLLLFAFSFGITRIALGYEREKTEHSSTDFLNSYRGNYVYIDFWASWCAPCRLSMPWLEKLQSHFGTSGLKVLAINLDSDRALAQKLLADVFRQKTRSFEVRYDPDGELAEAFKVKSMPSGYLIDPDGNIVTSISGARSGDKEKIEKILESRIKAKAI